MECAAIAPWETHRHQARFGVANQFGCKGRSRCIDDAAKAFFVGSGYKTRRKNQYGDVLREAILSDFLRPNIVFHRSLCEVEVFGQEKRRKVFVLTKQRENHDAEVTSGLQRDITKRYAIHNTEGVIRNEH